jgi:glycosyltransferase involved in cell wall biosynthesis
VVTVHDLYYERVPAAIPFVRRQYYRVGIPWSVRHCDAILAVSASTAADLASELPRSVGKVSVVHLGARADLVALDVPATEAEVPYFLQVAAVTRNKNIDTVVSAAIALRAAGHRFTVKVVGDDPYGLLARALDRPGAAEVIEPVGEVTPDALAGLYRGAVAVLNPSIYEGFGLPVLEAQSLGAPVISSRGGSLPEVAGDGARYFDHDDPDELQAAMAALLDDPDARAHLIERGTRNVARFSWERAAAETAAVLVGSARR